ncbi:ABC transporter substrate-binding protein [Streptomyces canus]|uniref:ABC transporter substrate-binding protein n=1 Tax=Streptomyces canus TaxID=58343 RepID=UPI0033D244B9
MTTPPSSARPGLARAQGPARRTVLSGALAASAGFVLASCSPSASSGDSTTLTVCGQSDNLTQVFNPFLTRSANALAYTPAGQGGFIYEPLVQINTVDIGKDIPWLAKSWKWSDGNKKLTLTLQTGVKWTDGKPFSAEDVVFTYELLKKYPGLNLAGVAFDTVRVRGSGEVIMTFTKPAEQFFTNIMSTPIVSQHVWSKVGDPTKYTDNNPVGTGPFKLASFSSQSFVLDRNEDYWQTKAEITSIRFIAFKDNQSMTNALVQGQVDWGGSYIADADKTYLARSKDNHYWAPQAGTDGLIPNLERWPLSDIAVRQAISLGVDRKQIAAASHDSPATSVTGLPMPAYEGEVAPQYKGVNFTQDKGKAERTLKDAGYAKGGDGYFHKNGKRVEFSISFPSSATEIASRVQVLVSQLKDIGIKLNVDTTSANDINVLTARGDFDSTMGYPVGPAPRAFSFYNDTMNPNLYYPVGKSTPTWQNIERFRNAEAADLFKRYSEAATDKDRQDILNKIQQVFVEELPWIPLFYWGFYADWSTAKVTGFPSVADPYFSPVPNPVVALRLKPR